VTSIDKERSVSIIQFLRSVAEIDESSSSSMNENLDDYFETKVLAKSHEDAEQVMKMQNKSVMQFLMNSAMSFSA